MSGARRKRISEPFPYCPPRRSSSASPRSIAGAIRNRRRIIYGRNATARISIVSISLINPHVVSVRYIRTVTRGEDVRTTHWVATLTFAYVNAPMSSTDRLVNPLGFVVSEYRADPEAIN